MKQNFTWISKTQDPIYFRCRGSTWHRKHLKRRFHAENASNVCRPRHAEEIWKCNNLGLLWICVWERLGLGNHTYIVMSSFSKRSVLKMFFVYTKYKSAVFIFLRFVERFRKTPFSWHLSVDGTPNRRNNAPFSWPSSVDGRPYRRNKAAFAWRISVDGRPNRRNNAPFSCRISVDGTPNRRNKAVLLNFSGVVWTGPNQGAQISVMNLHTSFSVSY